MLLWGLLTITIVQWAPKPYSNGCCEGLDFRFAFGEWRRAQAQAGILYTKKGASNGCLYTFFFFFFFGGGPYEKKYGKMAPKTLLELLRPLYYLECLGCPRKDPEASRHKLTNLDATRKLTPNPKPRQELAAEL